MRQFSGSSAVEKTPKQTKKEKHPEASYYPRTPIIVDLEDCGEETHKEQLSIYDEGTPKKELQVPLWVEKTGVDHLRVLRQESQNNLVPELEQTESRCHQLQSWTDFYLVSCIFAIKLVHFCRIIPLCLTYDGSVVFADELNLGCLN